MILINPTREHLGAAFKEIFQRMDAEKEQRKVSLAEIMFYYFQYPKIKEICEKVERIQQEIKNTKTQV